MKIRRVLRDKSAALWRRTGRRAVLLASVAVFLNVGVLFLHIGYAASPEIPEQQLQLVRAEKKLMAERAAEAAKPKPAAIAPKPAPVPTPVVISPPVAGHPWSIRELYVAPDSDAARQAQAWAASNPAGAMTMQKIAAQPQAQWFGDWSANLQASVNQYVSQAAAAQKMPVLVAYNIPSRDCSSYSAGGATGAAEYGAWIQQMANGIGSRPAVVILEPDAIPQLTTCLDPAGQQARLTMLKQAVAALKANKQTHVYIDAGNPGWHPAATMATRLKQAGIESMDGFSLNVSNFYATGDLVNYGKQISGMVGGKHFVLDTSRNGAGPTADRQWCNPLERALGPVPTTIVAVSPLVDALLWIKTPGQSDGTCNGGPSAGQWWADYALGLARKVGW